MAKLINAPFVKVEATKYTEVSIFLSYLFIFSHALSKTEVLFDKVGFHGRDVDTIIRDLVANAIVVTKAKLRKKYEKEYVQQLFVFFDVVEVVVVHEKDKRSC